MSVRQRKHGSPSRGRRRLTIQALECRRLLAAQFGSKAAADVAGLLPAEYRTFDGTTNNVANVHWGSADTPLLRLTTVEYVAGDLDGDVEVIATIWTGVQSFRERVSTLQSMISSIDDDERDYLFGGLGRDWLLGDSLDVAWS